MQQSEPEIQIVPITPLVDDNTVTSVLPKTGAPVIVHEQTNDTPIMAVPVEIEPAAVSEPTDINSQYNLIPIKVKISHYNPKAGGPNCSNFQNGVCVSRLANGQNWEKFLGQYNTIACPMSVPFGTQIMLDDNIFTCRDRGGMIVITAKGEYWIDILAAVVPYTYGQVKKAYILEPK